MATQQQKKELIDRILDKAMRVDEKKLDLDGVDFPKFTLLGVKRIDTGDKTGLHVLGTDTKTGSRLMMENEECDEYYIIESEIHNALTDEYGVGPKEGKEEFLNHKKEAQEREFEKLREDLELEVGEELLVGLFGAMISLDGDDLKKLFVKHCMAKLHNYMKETGDPKKALLKLIRENM